MTPNSQNSAAGDETGALPAWLAGLAEPKLDLATLRAGPVLGPAPYEEAVLYRIDGGGNAYLVLWSKDAAACERATTLLQDAGLAVPHVLATQGNWLLAHDLGAHTYLHQLSLDSAHQLYMDALGALLELQANLQSDTLPEFGRGQMAGELNLFSEFFLGRHLNVTPTATQAAQLDKVLTAVLDHVQAQPACAIHRNFQSRNLIVRPGMPGLLGLAGLANGPLTYDLVSLLRDAAVAWDEEMVLDWVVRYWQAARQQGLPVAPDIDTFYRDFEMTGVQRHLMQLGLYARLAYEGGEQAYLADIAQLVEYIRKAANRYTVLKPLARLLDEWEQKQPQVGYTF